MNIGAIISAIEDFAPRSLQESWDNSGLQIGLPDGETEVRAALICLDATEAVVDEAIARGCNLIVSHHPLFFRGVKSLTAANPAERAAMKAVRAGVAVYSAHTSLDSARDGISYMMARALGMEVTGVLKPAARTVRLTFQCAAHHAADLRLALADACRYSDVSVTVDGEASQAVTVETDGIPATSMEVEPLALVSVDVNDFDARCATVAADGCIAANSRFYKRLTGTTVDAPSAYGLGVTARYDKAVSGSEFVERLHKAFGTECIKVSAAYRPDMEVRTAGFCGGSAPDFAADAFSRGADIYVCGDIRYHDFSSAMQQGQVICDVGHFESEICAKKIFYNILSKKFSNFAVYLSEAEQNPILYL